MGGASSWYTMMAITGFLTAIWAMGKVAAQIGVSSIVLEVGVGIVLGPQVLKLIPSATSECFQQKVYDCDSAKYQRKIGEKGYKYCDLGAYLEKGRYVESGKNWTAGVWGADLPDGYLEIGGEKGGSYCLDPAIPSCKGRLLESDPSVDARVDPEVSEGSPQRHMGIPRRLAGDKKGKTEYDTYSECILESCNLDVNLECASVPDVFTLTGHVGVAMMIFESGLHFDFEQAKTVGPWASVVAVIGTFLPLASGAAMAVAFGFDLVPDALSAGTALAPTSVGIALKLLHEARALQTYFGQAVMTAAFVDDVLSLVLFSVLFNLGDDPDFWTFFPIILGIVFMVVAIAAAVYVWPPFIKFLFAKIPELKPHAKVTTHDEVLWILMLLTLVAYGQITHLCATHLWGCFIGGMSFAMHPHSHHVWVKQVKRLTCWFLRIFFACTLAWAIPVKELFSIPAFLKGSLMGIGPCILTKVLCGPFMGSARWVIGWAMTGRAEFAYFIAILAKSVNMMDPKLFAILVWALIYATIFAPLAFRFVLARYMLAVENGTVEANGTPTRGGSVGSIGQMTVGSTMSTGSQHSNRHHSGHLPDLEAELEEEAEEMRKLEYQKLKVDAVNQERRLADLRQELDEANQLNIARKAELLEREAEIDRLRQELLFETAGRTDSRETQCTI